MKAYSIFDDFTEEASLLLRSEGVELVIHPCGTPRPNADEMRSILEEYDCVIIGTSQKIKKDMFDNISTPRVIATASVGVDHIQIPEKKRDLVQIINTPKANAQSVAEYTFATILSCCKRLNEGNRLYRAGMDNKKLSKKPEDLYKKTIGLIGAGNISEKIIDYANCFGMNIICWTPHPQKHANLLDKNVVFTNIEELVVDADIISVNLPSNRETKGIISRELITRMKENVIFVSVSRIETIDIKALFEKAMLDSNCYICLDIDVDLDIVHNLVEMKNVYITPHIAGGTIETRKRMFKEIAYQIITCR